MLKKILLLNIAILFSFIAYSQEDFNEIMDKVIDTYTNTENYQTEMKYMLYSNNVSNIKKDELNSKIIKKGENYYVKMKETEMVFTSSFLLKISHPEKIILYSKLEQPISDLIKSQSPFIEFSKQFENQKIKNQTGYYECILSTPKESSMPYNKIVLNVSKTNYTVLKQIYYFNNSIEERYNKNATNTENERLEMVLKSFKAEDEISTDVFNFDKYLKKIKDDKYEPSNYIKGFKILTQ